MAALIRKGLLWLLAGFASLLFASLVAKPFEDWLISKNYYEAAPGWISSALGWTMGISYNHPFQLVFVSILSGAGGAWGHYLAAKRDSDTDDSRSTDFIMMSPAISNMLRDFWSGLNMGTFYELNAVNEQTKISLNALYARLKRIGIKTPDTDGYTQPWHYNMMQIGYLETILPFAKSGLIPEVKVQIDNYFKRYRETLVEVGEEARMPRELKAALSSPR
ncbi:MAG: hypothetical protein ACU0B7_03375 [Paracoccaceae bacterium]